MSDSTSCVIRVQPFTSDWFFPFLAANVNKKISGLRRSFLWVCELIILLLYFLTMCQKSRERPLLVMQLNQLPLYTTALPPCKNQQLWALGFMSFVGFKSLASDSSGGAMTFSKRAGAMTPERRAHPEDAGRVMGASAALKAALSYRCVSCSCLTGSCVRENWILH